MNKLKLKSIPIVFDEKEHVYTCTTNKELFTGVTTIIDVRAKDFLKYWTIKAGVKFLGWFDPFETEEEEGMKVVTEKLEKIKKFTPKQWYAILTEAKSAWTKTSREALKAGALAHSWIENYINGKEQDKPTDEKALSAINAFLDWEKQHHVEWLASELMVGSMKHKFAGTCDFIARIDGILTLGDFKTSNQISEDVAIQTAAYLLALDEMLKEGEERPKQRVVLRIPKNGLGFEYQRIDTDLSFDQETFLHMRELHRWDVYIKSRFTDNKGKIKLEHEI